MATPNTDNKTVCDECIEHEYTRQYIRRMASVTSCSYCNREGKEPIAIPVDDVIELVSEVVHSEYNDAADESVPYESREGGYQFPTLSAHEVLYDIGFYAGNEALNDEIAFALPDYAWIRRNPLSLTEDERLVGGWEEFARIVKHRVRYLLFPDREESWHDEEVRPEQMLSTLEKEVNKLDLITTLPVGTNLYRAIVHDPNESHATLLELGPPPTNKARFSNRMSPAGISLFYAGLSEEVAITETFVRKDDRPAALSIGTFELTEDIEVLNLVDLPPIPDLFNSDQRWQRPALIFLYGFRDDFVKPVPKDGREHIEYVPSQIVTEFFRYRFHDEYGRRVRGILYPSVQVDRGNACVLFVSYEDCADDWEFGEPLKPPFNLVGHETQELASAHGT